MSNSKLFGLVGVDKLENVPTTLQEFQAVVDDIKTDMMELLNDYPKKGNVAMNLILGLGFLLGHITEHPGVINEHPFTAAAKDEKTRKIVEYGINSYGLALQEDLGKFAEGVVEYRAQPIKRIDLNFKKLCASVGLTQEKLNMHIIRRERFRVFMDED